MCWLMRNAKTFLTIQSEGKIPSREPRERGECYKMCVEETDCVCGHVGQMDFANTVMNFRFLYKEKN
jgi:hypothetical protein